MGAAGSIDTSSLTEDEYDQERLRELFGEEYDEGVFKKFVSRNGKISRDVLVKLCQSQKNM